MIIPYGFLEEAVNMQQFRKYINDKGLGNCDAKQLYQEIVKLMRGGYNIPDKVALDAYGTSELELKAACAVALKLNDIDAKIQEENKKNESFCFPGRIKLWEDKNSRASEIKEKADPEDLLINDGKLGKLLRNIQKELKNADSRSIDADRANRTDTNDPAKPIFPFVQKTLKDLTADNFNAKIKELFTRLKKRQEWLNDNGDDSDDDDDRHYSRVWYNTDSKKVSLIKQLLSDKSNPYLLYGMKYDAGDKDSLVYRLEAILKLLKGDKKNSDRDDYSKDRKKYEEPEYMDAEIRKQKAEAEQAKREQTPRGQFEKVLRDFNRQYYRRGNIGVASASQIAAEKCKAEYEKQKETYDGYWNEDHSNWRYNDFKYLDNDLLKVFNIPDSEVADSFDKVKPGIEKSLKRIVKKQK